MQWQWAWTFNSFFFFLKSKKFKKKKKVGLIQNLEIIKGKKPLNRIIKAVLCNEKYLKKKAKFALTFWGTSFWAHTRKGFYEQKGKKYKEKRWLLAAGWRLTAIVSAFLIFIPLICWFVPLSGSFTCPAIRSQESAESNPSCRVRW